MTDWVKSMTDLIKSVTEWVKSVTDLINSLTEWVKSLIDLIRSATDLINSMTDRVKSVTDLIKWMTDLINWTRFLTRKPRPERRLTPPGHRLSAWPVPGCVKNVGWRPERTRKCAYQPLGSAENPEKATPTTCAAYGFFGGRIYVLIL